MATSKYKTYRNLVFGAILLFFTLQFLKGHFFPGGRSFDDLIFLQESGVETKATILNLDELAGGERTLKYTYEVKGETYQGKYELQEALNPLELLAPVTYNLRRPKVHQYNLLTAMNRAERLKERKLGWKFLIFPIGSFLMFYWGFSDLRKLKIEAQDADKG